MQSCIVTDAPSSTSMCACVEFASVVDLNVPFAELPLNWMRDALHEHIWVVDADEVDDCV